MLIINKTMGNFIFRRKWGIPDFLHLGHHSKCLKFIYVTTFDQYRFWGCLNRGNFLVLYNQCEVRLSQ